MGWDWGGFGDGGYLTFCGIEWVGCGCGIGNRLGCAFPKRFDLDVRSEKQD